MLLRRLLQSGVNSESHLSTLTTLLPAITGTVVASETTVPLASWARSFPFRIPSLYRPFASYAEKDTSEESTDSRRRTGADLLRSLNAYNFREHLEKVSETKLHMPFADLMTLAQQRGAAASPSESRALCEALVAAGVVFRHRDVVYISPDDVAEMIMAALPDTEEELEKRLESIQSQLQPLEKQKRAIEDLATQRSSYVMLGILCFLVLQLAAFVRLTFWELSWDIIEPVAFFVSLGYGILAYVYFIVMHESFEFPLLEDRIKSHFWKREKQTNGQSFDEKKYRKLLNELQRYQKYLSRIRA